MPVLRGCRESRVTEEEGRLWSFRPLWHRRPRGDRLRSPGCTLWPCSLLGCSAGHVDRAASKGLGQLRAGSGTGSWILGPGSSYSRSQKRPQHLHGIGDFEERREKRTKNGCREEGAAEGRKGGRAGARGGGTACWWQGQEFRCATLGDLGHILAHVGRTDWTDQDPCTTRVSEQLSLSPHLSLQRPSPSAGFD